MKNIQKFEKNLDFKLYKENKANSFEDLDTILMYVEETQTLYLGSGAVPEDIDLTAFNESKLGKEAFSVIGKVLNEADPGCDITLYAPRFNSGYTGKIANINMYTNYSRVSTEVWMINSSGVDEKLILNTHYTLNDINGEIAIIKEGGVTGVITIIAEARNNDSLSPVNFTEFNLYTLDSYNSSKDVLYNLLTYTEDDVCQLEAGVDYVVTLATDSGATNLTLNVSYGMQNVEITKISSNTFKLVTNGSNGQTTIQLAGYCPVDSTNNKQSKQSNVIICSLSLQTHVLSWNTIFNASQLTSNGEYNVYATDVYNLSQLTSNGGCSIADGTINVTVPGMYSQYIDYNPSTHNITFNLDGQNRNVRLDIDIEGTGNYAFTRTTCDIIINVVPVTITLDSVTSITSGNTINTSFSNNMYNISADALDKLEFKVTRTIENYEDYNINIGTSTINDYLISNGINITYYLPRVTGTTSNTDYTIQENIITFELNDGKSGTRILQIYSEGKGNFGKSNVIEFNIKINPIQYEINWLYSGSVSKEVLRDGTIVYRTDIYPAKNIDLHCRFVNNKGEIVREDAPQVLSTSFECIEYSKFTGMLNFYGDGIEYNISREINYNISNTSTGNGNYAEANVTRVLRLRLENNTVTMYTGMGNSVYATLNSDNEYTTNITLQKGTFQKIWLIPANNYQITSNDISTSTEGLYTITNLGKSENALGITNYFDLNATTNTGEETITIKINTVKLTGKALLESSNGSYNSCTIKLNLTVTD